MADDNTSSSLELAIEVTIAWLSNQNNRVSAEDVPSFLRTIHAMVTDLSKEPAVDTEESQVGLAGEEFTPAVSVRRSLASKDHIISLIDGKPYRTLRRHLTTNGLTPEQYRQRYNLKPDYPMVAENYSAQRREMAKKLGLGRKPGEKIKRAPRAPKAS